MDVAEHFRTILQNWWRILVVSVLVAATVYVAEASRSKQYAASAELQVTSGRASIGQATADGPLNNDVSVSLGAPPLDGIYYVKVEGAAGDVFGIGGYQPHRAEEIFANRYGDCKDKVTLLSAMLREIGVERTMVVQVLGA